MKEQTNIKQTIQADNEGRFDAFVIPPPNTFENKDCMDVLPFLPAGHFDLAIVDTPYGLKIGGNGKITNVGKYKNVSWDDSPPDADYFRELFRVSKNQIVWGGNYMTDELAITNGWILWDKKCKNDWDDNFSDGEMAWTSFKKPLRIYRHLWMGALRKMEFDEAERIHPTQKPIGLYKWLLRNYAKAGDKILDTHVGSGSSLIACKQLGFEYYGTEIDKDNYTKAEKRLRRAYYQPELFEAAV